MEALIFDMDGVVVDSVGHWAAVRERIIADELGVPDVDISDLIGLNARDEYDYLAKDHELARPQDEYVDLLDAYVEEIYEERTVLLAGFEDVLRKATANEIQLGLVSASDRRRVEMVLERFELYEFDIVVAGDDLSGPSKPDPAIYEHATSLLDVAGNQCVAVEDSEHGVAAAKGAGMYCIGYAHHPDQPLAAADETFEAPEALISRLLECCQNRAT